MTWGKILTITNDRRHFLKVCSLRNLYRDLLNVTQHLSAEYTFHLGVL